MTTHLSTISLKESYEEDEDEYDQWFLTNGGFSDDERSMSGFARRYTLTPRQEYALFREYFVMMLEEQNRRFESNPSRNLKKTMYFIP